MEEYYYYPEDHYPESFQVLQAMRKKHEMVDCWIIVGEKKIICNSVILSAFSRYLYDMFLNLWQSTKLAVLELSTVEHTGNSVKLLIDFMYTSRLKIDKFNVKELLISSSIFLMQNVKMECMKYLKRSFSNENLMELRDLAVKHKFDYLHHELLSYVLKNFNDVVKSNEFLSFSFEFLRELIKSFQLKIETEKVVQSIITWLTFDKDGRSKHLLDLLKAFNLNKRLLNYELFNHTCFMDLIKSDPESELYLFGKSEHVEKRGNENILVNDTSTSNNKRQKMIESLPILNISEEPLLGYYRMDDINNQLNFTKSKEATLECAEKMAMYDHMNTMRKNGTLCDINIRIGDKIFCAHKLVLATNCKYFEKMLTGNFKESFVKELNIKHIAPDMLELLIEYMYTSHLKIYEHNVLDILVASDFFLIEKVRLACVHFIKDNINTDNFLMLKHFALTMNIYDLYAHCISFFTDNFFSVIKTKDFLTLSYNRFMVLIKNDNIDAEEVEIYECIMYWVNHDLKSRSKFLLGLMRTLKMSRIPYSYLTQNIANKKIIKMECQDLLDKTLEEYTRKDNDNSIAVKSKFYANRRNFKMNKIILSISVDSSKHLIVKWTTLGTESYSMKKLFLDDVLVYYLGRIIVLGDGRILCIRCSACDKKPSSIFDGKINTWIRVCEYDFKVCSFTNEKCGVFSVVELDNCVYIMTYKGSFHCYNIDEDKWSELKAFEQMFTTSNKLEIIDRLIVSNGTIFVVSKVGIFKYCKSTDSWSLVNRENIPSNWGFASCVLNNYFYLIGGIDNKDCDQVKTTLKFNLKTHVWSRVADMNYERFGAGAVAVNNLIYVMGGKDRDSAEVYDPKIDKWTLLKNKLPTRNNQFTKVFVLNPEGNIDPENISDYYDCLYL